MDELIGNIENRKFVLVGYTCPGCQARYFIETTKWGEYTVAKKVAIVEVGTCCDFGEDDVIPLYELRMDD